MARDMAVLPSQKRQTPNIQVLAPLARLREEMDQWLGDLPQLMQHLQSGKFRLPLAAPAVDMKETETGYQLTAEVPGIDAKDVEVSVVDGMIRIAGEKKEERQEKDRDYTYSERSYGTFERQIAAPPDADLQKIKAKVKKGVLEITLPKDKSAEDRKRQIPVEAE
ncbi:Hsp20 family protein [Sphingomonas sp. 179-I 2A4 NHS]|uniref:Hsp20/alpha crystallin family protein n=1 Tax=unclassified Sphingomonas TaxID=196159 RepID=UPI003879AA29